MEKLEKYDIVEYLDVANATEGGHLKTVKVPKRGVWDGAKVAFDDGEQTTVRNPEWLGMVKKGGGMPLEERIARLDKYFVMSGEGGGFMEKSDAGDWVSLCDVERAVEEFCVDSAICKTGRA